MIILNIAVKVSSLVFVILAWKLYKPPPEGTSVVVEIGEKVGIHDQQHTTDATNVGNYSNAQYDVSRL